MIRKSYRILVYRRRWRDFVYDYSQQELLDFPEFQRSRFQLSGYLLSTHWFRKFFYRIHSSNYVPWFPIVLVTCELFHFLTPQIPQQPIKYNKLSKDIQNTRTEDIDMCDE